MINESYSLQQWSIDSFLLTSTALPDMSSPLIVRSSANSQLKVVTQRAVGSPGDCDDFG